MRRSHARYSAFTASATTSCESGADGAEVTGPERTVGPAGLGELENIFLYHGRESVVAGGSAAATVGAVAPTISAAAVPQARNRLMASPLTPPAPRPLCGAQRAARAEQDNPCGTRSPQ